MTKTKRRINLDDITIIEFLIVVGVIAILILAAYFIFKAKPVKSFNPASNQSSSTTTKITANPYAVLPPANVPPKLAECSTPVSYGSQGNPSPIQCPNGNLNVAAWTALSALEPTVMSLGYNASSSQVQTAICNDANAADADSSASESNAIEGTVYQISKIYYGWSFAGDPSAVLSSGNC